MIFGSEWIFIIILIVILIFGAKKIPELARGLGRATTEFEKAKRQANKELHNFKNFGTNNDNNDKTYIDREKLESIADTLQIDFTNKNDEELKSAIDTELNKKQK